MLGNMLPPNGNAYPHTCEWPTQLGAPSSNNGIKVNADGCAWALPAAFGIDECDENTDQITRTITESTSGTMGPLVSTTITNTTPYTQSGTYTFWHGPVEYRLPAGAIYSVGRAASVTARHDGEPYPPANTTFPFIDINNPPTGAAPLTGDQLCCIYPFVLDAYKSVVGRYPDAGALAFFTNQIATGGLLTADALYDNINQVGGGNNELHARIEATDGGTWTRCITLAPGQSLDLGFAPYFEAQHRNGVNGQISVQGYGVHAQLQPVNPDIC